MATSRQCTPDHAPHPSAPRTIAVAATAGAALALMAAPSSAAAITEAAPGQGMVRLAHLSPDTPAVDVYLYTAGKKTPRLVLRHVGYGALSPYQRLGGGSYTVAMRPADAAATSKPVLSTTVRVQGGGAYTVAGMGPYKGIKLKVLNDSVSLPGGRAGLRVIAASLKEPALDVTAGGKTLSKSLRFSTVTPYRRLAAKTTDVQVKGRNGTTGTKVKLMEGSVHTVVVLDGDSGLKLVTLRDAAQRTTPPSGGVNTGLGGLTARPQGHRPEGTPWGTAGLIALAGLGAGGAVILRRRRTQHAEGPNNH